MKLKYILCFLGVLVVFYTVLSIGLQQKDIFISEYVVGSKAVTLQEDSTTFDSTVTSATSTVEQTDPVPEHETVPTSYLIDDFEVIFQESELPTGCEITAMTMVLNYYGFDVDKVTMATEYLPILPYTLYYDDYGTLIGNDLYNYFLGDPATTGGVTCGAGAITFASNSYLESQDTTLTAVDMTGIEPSEMYEYVRQGIPVMVFVTIGMVDREITQEWYTVDGRLCNYSTSDHGAVLIGYTDDTVTLADPISGIYECGRQQFESVIESRNRQCVILMDSSSDQLTNERADDFIEAYATNPNSDYSDSDSGLGYSYDEALELPAEYIND